MVSCLNNKIEKGCEKSDSSVSFLPGKGFEMPIFCHDATWIALVGRLRQKVKYYSGSRFQDYDYKTRCVTYNPNN